MPDLLHEGALTMAIFRKKTDKEIEQEKKLLGNTTPNPDLFLPVPDFTYSSDCLAQMIVDAWADPNYQQTLLQRNAQGLPTHDAVKLPRNRSTVWLQSGARCRDLGRGVL